MSVVAVSAAVLCGASLPMTWGGRGEHLAVVNPVMGYGIRKCILHPIT